MTQDVRDELIDPFRVLKKNIENAAEEMGINVNGDRELGEIDGPDSKSNRNLQHVFSKILHSRTAKDFMSRTAEAKDQARLHSCEGSLSGAWLYNVPTNDHFTMFPNIFRTCCMLCK